MEDTPARRPPVPRELLTLRTALRTFGSMLDDAATWAEQAADVNREIDPTYAELLDRLRGVIGGQDQLDLLEAAVDGLLAHLPKA